MSSLTTALTTTVPAASMPGNAIRARRAGFLADLVTVAGRALRSLPRDVEGVIPSLVIPAFFFAVNIGAFQDIASGFGSDFDYKAFQLPVAVLFGITGVSRAMTLVTDIQDGYFDRLTMTPVRRPTLLLGLMVADFALVVALTLPVILLGVIVGAGFETGVLGAVVFVVLSAVWGLVFTGFPYAIALKTGNPAAVNMSFLLFFPFLFLTTAFAPKHALTGWLSAVATFNPVTYLLDALRSLTMEGWEPGTLLKGIAAVAAVGLVSFGMALSAFRGRIRSAS